MSPEEAERLAIQFGLTYLSLEGYEKLSALLNFVIEQERGKPNAPLISGGAGWLVW